MTRFKKLLLYIISIPKIKSLDERGFTLAELVVATMLVTLLAYGFAMGMLQFVIGYQETRDFIQLQRDMLAVVNTARRGFAIRGVHDSPYLDAPLVGLLTAQKVSVNHNRDTITISPVGGDDPINRIWARLRHNINTGEVLYDYQFGSVSRFGLVLFPTVKDRIGRVNRYRITRLEFNNPYPEYEQPQLISIIIEGSVRYRQRGRIDRRRLLTEEQDQKLNVRSVRFDSIIYVGNADKFDNN